MLDVKKLCKKYGSVRGIQDVSFHVERGRSWPSLAKTAPLNEMAKNGETFVFSEDREKLEGEAEAARRLGAAAEFVNTVPLPFAAGAGKDGGHGSQSGKIHWKTSV